MKMYATYTHQTDMYIYEKQYPRRFHQFAAVHLIATERMSAVAS